MRKFLFYIPLLYLLVAVKTHGEAKDNIINLKCEFHMRKFCIIFCWKFSSSICLSEKNDMLSFYNDC